jgi:phosphatidate cytidylyltransferase
MRWTNSPGANAASARPARKSKRRIDPDFSVDRKNQDRLQTVKQRLITALLVTPLAIALILLLPTTWFAVFIAGLCLVALWEWTRLSGMRSRPWRAVLVACEIALLGALWCTRGSWYWWAAIGAGAVWWPFAFLWLRRYSFTAAPTRENALIKLAAGALSVLPAWVAMMQLHLAQTDVHTWGLYALMLVWAADTCAYFVGSRWGKTKLAPQISPGKTIEGVYGALAGSASIAVAGGWLLNVRGLALFGLVLLGMVAVALSIVGDLFESLIKRHANVKDSGNMFPGHGGVYDRLDGVFAALPLFALGKAALGL